jgi:hypothetical protein
MIENASSNQLVIKNRPILSWVMGGLCIIAAIFIFIVNKSVVGALPFLFFALLLLLIFGSVNTITADNLRRVLTVSTRSVFNNKISEYPFSEIANFEVEASRNRTSTRHRNVNYRIVMIKTNGEKIPLQNVFTSFYDDKARKAKALSQYLNLPGWEDKPTNLFQTAMQSQVALTSLPTMTKDGTTSGVDWKIEVHTIGGKPVTHWISANYTCPGNFLLVSQKPANSPSLGGGGGLLGNLVAMVYQQILGMYGFLPSDTPGYSSAVAVTTLDDRFDRNFGTLSNELGFGKSLLNPWTLTPFIQWAEKYPLKTITTSDQVGQLAVLYSPRGLQVAILGSLPATETDEIISLGVELVKAQGGGKPIA